MKARVNLLALLSLTLAAAACDSSRLTWGDGNSIIVTMRPDLWTEVQDDVYSNLETTTYTVRDEKNFTVTYADPSDEDWRNLRRFRVMLVVGRADDWFMQDVLGKLKDPEPGVHEVERVWSQDQSVTVVLLPEEGEADFLRDRLPALHDRFDEGFRVYTFRRMFQTGPDTALAGTLRRNFGFELTVPNVYDWEGRDSVFIFRNDNPDPSELIRQVAVTWAAPLPEGLQGEDLVEWRTRLSESHYTNAQVTDVRQVTGRPFDHRGRPAYEVSGRWSNPPELGWPAGGTYIARGIPCPEQDRMYLLDAWLYAPGREHYEYVIQLNYVLDTFRCGANLASTP